MSKKPFALPTILSASPTPGNDVVIGGGTGEGGTHAVPMSYEAWLNSVWAEDLVGENDGIDAYDYGAWWYSNYSTDPSTFSPDLWSSLNPGLNWDDYVY